MAATHVFLRCLDLTNLSWDTSGPASAHCYSSRCVISTASLITGEADLSLRPVIGVLAGAAGGE